MFYSGRNLVRYEVHIDASGNGLADFTFAMEFGTQYSPHLVMTDDGTSTASPLPYNHPGPITGLLDPNLGIFEPYTLWLITSLGTFPLENTSLGSTTFFKPMDNPGGAIIPDYAAYADQHIFDLGTPSLPNLTGRSFVGQREDPFVMNDKAVFDLAGPPSGPTGNSHAGHNVLSFTLEVNMDFLTDNGANPVLGIYATASVPQNRALNPSPPTHPGDVVLPPSPGDPYVRLSRLGMPLTNMLFIGVNSKDRYNALDPSTDFVEFQQSFTNPALAALMGFPSSGRLDVLDFFLKGLPGVNQTGSLGDMLRIDTRVPPVDPAQQDPMGIFGDPPDAAGFPNGRRLGDDVVDIVLQALQGRLLGGPGPFDATDGVSPDPLRFVDQFPFLQVPSGRDRNWVCVTLTSSTATDRAAFQPIGNTYVDPARPDRIATSVPAEPLVYFLLDAEISSGSANIENIVLDGNRLEIVVGQQGGSS